MLSWKKPLSLGAAITLGALLMGSALTSSAHTPSPYPENPQHPGLPQGLGYIQPRATTITETTAAKQWLRMPALQTISIIPPSQPIPADPVCRRGDYSRGSQYTGELYAVSPPGSPEPFGFIGPHKARTVAFGSIPVEATVVVSQLRDDRNLPIPLRYSQLQVTYCEHTTPFPPLPRPGGGNVYESWKEATVSGPVNVRITQLQVDGVEVRLSGQCRTKQPSELLLTGPEVHNSDPDLRPGIDYGADSLDMDARMEARVFTGTFGGLLTGNIDIADFTGCTTTDGDDISALLTSAVSGPENAIHIRSEGIAGEPYEESCAWTTSCEPMPDMPLPTRG